MIKLPEQLQLGFRTKQNEKLKLVAGKSPLAYMRRYGNTAAERKLTKSIQDWCGVPKDTPWQPIVLDNTPVKGFKFGSSVSRYSTSNKFVEVIDPRGFMLQLPIESLAILLGSATMTQGIIENACVWGFDGQNLVLINVESEHYKKVLDKIEQEKKKEQDLKQNKVTKKNLVVGGVYADKYGKLYRYFGYKKMKVHSKYGAYHGSYSNPPKTHIVEKPVHVFYRVSHEKSYGKSVAKDMVYYEISRGLSGWYMTDSNVNFGTRELEYIMQTAKDEDGVSWEKSTTYVGYYTHSDKIYELDHNYGKTGIEFLEV